MSQTSLQISTCLLSAGESTAAGSLEDILAILQALGVLVVLCACTWWGLRLLARRGLAGAGPGRRMRVLERIPLGPRSGIALVEVQGRRLVVGIAEGAAPRLLHALTVDAAAGSAGSEQSIEERVGTAPPLDGSNPDGLERGGGPDAG